MSFPLPRRAISCPFNRFIAEQLTFDHQFAGRAATETSITKRKQNPKLGSDQVNGRDRSTVLIPHANPFDPEKVLAMFPEYTPGNSAIQ